MKKNFRESFIFFIVFFLLFFAGKVESAGALELYSIEPFSGIEWTFETTRGIQNIFAKEGVSDKPNSQVVGFKGLLFHSYYDKQLFTKAQLNMGFSKIPNFFWTDSMNSVETSNESLLNDILQCIEFDSQFLLPTPQIIESREIYLFTGYSFVNYRFKIKNSIDSLKVNTLTVGFQYNHYISRTFSQNFYFSYSPFGVATLDFNDIIRCLNFGGEVIANFNKIGFTLFVAFRKGLDKGSYIFDESTYRFNATEIGLSFHANLI